MNSAQRRLIIDRDGRICVHCKNTCGVCRPPSPTLAPAVWWKLDATYSPANRITVDHLLGRSQRGVEKTEAPEHCWALCSCCNIGKSKAMTEEGLAYAAAATKAMPPEWHAAYAEALAQESIDRPKRREKKAKARKALYQKAVAKHGTPKIPSRPMTPKPIDEAPKKKGASRWAWAPIHPTYQNPTR